MSYFLTVNTNIGYPNRAIIMIDVEFNLEYLHGVKLYNLSTIWIQGLLGENAKF